MITKEDIQEAGLSRKDFAKRMGLKYATVSSKLSGFSDWIGNELDRAAQILADAKKDKQLPF